jgi:hypothetical protein
MNNDFWHGSKNRSYKRIYVDELPVRVFIITFVNRIYICVNKCTSSRKHICSSLVCTSWVRIKKETGGGGEKSKQVCVVCSLVIVALWNKFFS